MKGKRVEWLYNFKEGGFNTEYAYSKKEAILQAKLRWEGSNNLTPDEDSFRVDERDLEILMNNFY